jgi:hypothetical protein
MKRSLVLLGIALSLSLVVSAASAGVGVMPVAYSKIYMRTALQALGYPRAHLSQLTCAGLGHAINQGPAHGLENGRAYRSFRCVAQWQHHGRKVFYAAGSGYGGWLCVGSSVAGCSVLRRGYASGADPATGYVQNHFGLRKPKAGSGCPARPSGYVAAECFQIKAPPARPTLIGITAKLIRVDGFTGDIITGAVLSG